jgi:serine/threonine-protein kinase
VREARAAAALSSEHVTRVLDVGTLESGAPYMVMEYLAGSDLSDLLRANGQLSIPDALGVMLQACDAIAEAHEVGIIHRDLKPSNLFVTTRRDGSPLVKVLDFGISKKVDLNTQGASQSLTVSGLVIGSPLYMSPEQLRSAKAADARSDIWSLGVILYELLTGNAPFAGETLGEVLSRIVADPPTPIRRLRPEIPKSLEAVIMQCLERDLDRRIQTVGDLAARLAPFAPREASISVDRVGRSSRPRPGPQLTTPPPQAKTATSSPPWEGSDRGSRQAVETGPAWLTSGAAPRESRVPSRARRTIVVAFIGVLSLAGFAGAYRFGKTKVVADHPSSPVSPPPPPAPEVQAAPVLTVATATVLTPLGSAQPAPIASAAPPPPAVTAVVPVVTMDATPVPTVSVTPDAGTPPRVRRRPPARPQEHPATEDDLLHDRR